jgi:hypothetical protein
VRSRSHHCRLTIYSLVAEEILAATKIVSDNVEIKLSPKERKRAIEQISNASGIAQYAINAKMTDGNIMAAIAHLEILSLTKSANNYNRCCQSQKTAEANKKLKQFIELDNSELYKAGKWLVDALSKSGQERKRDLLAKGLLHKDDYNHAIVDLTDTIATQEAAQKQQTENSIQIIERLEITNDSLRVKLIDIKAYIIKKHGMDDWNNVSKTIDKNVASK